MELQLDSMDVELRNSLWNLVHMYFIEPNPQDFLSGFLAAMARAAHVFFFKLPLDELPDYGPAYTQQLKNLSMDTEWYQVYDFLEWLIDYMQESDSDAFSRIVNNILQSERSGYRVVGKLFAPITKVEEIREIELAAARMADFDSVGEHIRTSIQLLSDRKKPDFRNSIKEAISAVEAPAKIVSNGPKASLADALKVLEEAHAVPPPSVSQPREARSNANCKD